MFRIALALFAVVFVLVSDVFAICPVLFPPITRTRVTVVQNRYVGVAPMVAVQAPAVAVQAVPMTELPAPAAVVPPTTMYYRQRTVYQASPMVSGVVGIDGQTGAQRRHAKKAAKETEKSAKHAAKAQYWESRS